MSNDAPSQRIDQIGYATELEVSAVRLMIKKTGILSAVFLMQMNIGFCQGINAGVKKMQLPSFERVSTSPEVADLGVAVKLDASSFRAGEPIVIYGSYRIDRELIQKTHDEPLTWILIVVTRKDQPMAWVKLVRDKPN